MDKKKTGSFLKELRKEKKLTQVGFSRAFSEFCCGEMGIYTDATVSKWERGESLPNIEDIRRLARFYGVTADEILDGEKKTEMDFDKKYFLSNPRWYMNRQKEADLYKLRERQELEIETRFRSLLKKMIVEGLTLSENAEFDYLATNFYIIYTETESDDYACINDVKFRIVRTVSLMHNSSPAEKFWEAYKPFESRFMQKVERDVCDGMEDAEEILRNRVRSLETFEKDMLLAAIQVVNVTNTYGRQDVAITKLGKVLPSVYEQKYNRPYNEEQLTKKAIKLLVECGARLNTLLFGYRRDKVIKVDVLNELIELYEKFRKPIIIPVYENGVYNFFEVDNTPLNREKAGRGNRNEVLDEEEYSDLERKLYNGDRESEKTVPEWVGGTTEEEMIRYMRLTIRDLSLKDYLSARDEKLTAELIGRIDGLSLSDIRQTYFTRRQNE